MLRSHAIREGMRLVAQDHARHRDMGGGLRFNDHEMAAGAEGRVEDRPERRLHHI
jgi:hypothetical protein